LCFNEIKIDEDKLNSAGIKSAIPLKYHQYWNCCKSKKGYSGTAIITKVPPKSVHYGIGLEIVDQEGRALTLEFEHFIVTVVYAPHSG
jgi:exodeoxyribonuclease-3